MVTYTFGWKKFIISTELIITVLKRTSEIISFTGEPVTQYHKLGALNRNLQLRSELVTFHKKSI